MDLPVAAKKSWTICRNIFPLYLRKKMIKNDDDNDYDDDDDDDDDDNNIPFGM